MADVKISALPASTTPLAGTEVLPIVQGGATKQVSIANVTAGRAIAATSITTDTYKAASSSGGVLQNSGGTPQLQWGAGGGNNLSVDVAININPANAAVAISPTGTGTVTINPATASTMNNVAIGGTTPLAGSFTTLGATGVATFSAGTASAPAITTTGDTNTGIFFPAADTIAFTEGGVESMRISSAGNLGLGFTPSAWFSTFKGININYANIGGSSANGTMLIYGNSYLDTSVTEKYLTTAFATKYVLACDIGSHIWQTAPSGTAGNNITFTTAMLLDVSGNLTISGATATKASGTTWANPSDVRLKENITNFTKGLNELLQVNVKKWEYNGKGDTVAGTKGLGVIADEIMQVLPETVDTYKAKLNSDDEEKTDIKRFDATEITWLLVNAVKEQQKLIENLTIRLNALEGK